jgi:hypothetical protein
LITLTVRLPILPYTNKVRRTLLQLGPLRCLAVFFGDYHEIMTTSQEVEPLLNPQIAAAAAVSGAGFINSSTEKIKKARAEGPLTFRTLGFLGGLAMIISNGLAILDRFFSFNFAGAMIAFYGVLFGVIITMLEAPGPCSQRLQGGIRFYAKFLDFTWGRGALYFFVGTLQVSNWNMLDWAVGGFMIFVGVTAIGVGIAAARDLRLLKFAIQNENHLKEKWNQHDADGNGTLDAKELTAFVADAGVDMSRNEIAATFLALDKNFDEKITYEEFFSWWTAAGTYGAGTSMSV